jgi:ELWxxDGT repeat protein
MNIIKSKKRIFLLLTLIFGIILICYPSRISADSEAQILKDINLDGGDSYPQNLTLMDNIFYFSANDAVNGYELWKSDGTETGTTLVKDINSGSSSSYPDYLTVINDTLFFVADDGIHGEELWKSDGTEEGTVMLKDIYNGSTKSNVTCPTVLRNTLFFTANDGINGYELWKSDGTQEGTVIVKDIDEGGGSSYPYNYPEYFVIIENTLYFTADDGINGGELWKSDGTQEGTVMVKDIDEGSSGSSAYYLFGVGDTLYFTADDGINGDALWKSDGTQEGTVMVKDGLYWDAFPIASIGNTLFFGNEDDTHGIELWKSDGTETGTIMVKDIYPGSNQSLSNMESISVAVLNDILYFNAEDDLFGNEIWRSDGTEEGTYILKDVRVGTSHSYPYHITNYGNSIYFSAYDSTDSLWESDGTENGTKKLIDITFPSASRMDPYFFSWEGSLYLNADENPYGSELWKIDIDKTPPVGGVSINSDDLYTKTTQVTLDIIGNDPAFGVTEMVICNNSQFTGCTWETYKTSKNWTLPSGEGIKTVYIKFKDGAGNISSTYSDSITYHTLSLIVTNINSITNIPDQTFLSYFVTSTNVTVAGTTQPNNIVYITHEQETISSVAEEDGSFSIKIFLNRGPNTITYYSRDLSGNQSESKTLSLTVHTPSITITNIGLITNIPNRTELTYYFTSTNPRILGTTEAKSTASFEYDEEIYNAKADGNGKFSITLTVQRGENSINYYSTDISGNRSLVKTLTLIVGTENFPDWLLTNMGLIDEETDIDEEIEEEDVIEEPNEQEEEEEEIDLENDEEPQEQTGTIAPSTKIRFTNDSGTPLVRAVVEIEGETFVTDSNGEIFVENLEDRKYNAEIRYDGKQYEAEILGAAGANSGTVIVKESQSINWNKVILFGGIGFGLIVIIVFLIIFSRKKETDNEENVNSL